MIANLLDIYVNHKDEKRYISATEMCINICEK